MWHLYRREFPREAEIRRTAPLDGSKLIASAGTIEALLNDGNVFGHLGAGYRLKFEDNIDLLIMLMFESISTIRHCAGSMNWTPQASRAYRLAYLIEASLKGSPSEEDMRKLDEVIRQQPLVEHDGSHRDTPWRVTVWEEPLEDAIRFMVTVDGEHVLTLDGQPVRHIRHNRIAYAVEMGQEIAIAEINARKGIEGSDRV